MSKTTMASTVLIGKDGENVIERWFTGKVNETDKPLLPSLAIR
jgi:hypothetical protein